MTFLSPVMAAIATALTGGGLLLIYSSWKRKSGNKGYLMPAGWGAILVSVWPWALAGGTARGQVLGLAVLTLFALALIALTTNWKTVRKERRQTAQKDQSGTSPTEDEGRSSKWRQVFRFLLAGPFSLIAATAFGLAVLAVGKGNLPEGDEAISNYIVFLAFAVPVLWSFLMVWALMDQRLNRILAGLLVITGLGAIVIH
ncbi:hypothetical protein [Emcibacter sp.]|uniref:hypothetical protein n=1 Tax=Emcibacter sp. TaxID=1979954 RepID=UPI003A915727